VIWISILILSFEPRPTHPWLQQVRVRLKHRGRDIAFSQAAIWVDDTRSAGNSFQSIVASCDHFRKLILRGGSSPLGDLLILVLQLIKFVVNPALGQ